MPAPGHQYNSSAAAAANPFEEPPPRMSEYTAQEIATLQSRLDKQLGPEYISTRQGPGGNRVHYLAAEKVINLANQVFGFSGWSSQIKNVQIDFVDEPAPGRISLGLSIITRITLKNGVYHEDIGYGHIENARGKAAAFEKAKKEAATDSLKRALRTFGNVLGNCLYDKDYLTKVTKIKIAPSKWDAENLHRHPDYAPVKRESIDDVIGAAQTASMSTGAIKPTPALVDGQAQRVPQHQQLGDSRGSRVNGISDPGTTSSSDDALMAEFEDEFDGGNLFDEIGFDDANFDELALAQADEHNDNEPAFAEKRPYESIQPPSTNTRPTRGSNLGIAPPPPLRNDTAAQRPPIQFSHPSTTPRRSGTLPPSNLGHTPQQPQLPVQHEPPVGFITSRAAEMLVNSDNPPSNVAALPKFNPKAESPSIRKTSGFDHARSAPIRREAAQTRVGDSPARVVQKPSPAVGHQQQHRPPQSSPSPYPGSRATHATSYMEPAHGGSFVNQHESTARKIGMPPGSGGFGPPPAARTTMVTPYKAPTPLAGAKRGAPSNNTTPSTLQGAPQSNSNTNNNANGVAPSGKDGGLTISSSPNTAATNSRAGADASATAIQDGYGPAPAAAPTKPQAAGAAGAAGAVGAVGAGDNSGSAVGARRPLADVSNSHNRSGTGPPGSVVSDSGVKVVLPGPDKPYLRSGAGTGPGTGAGASAGAGAGGTVAEEAPKRRRIEETR